MPDRLTPRKTHLSRGSEAFSELHTWFTLVYRTLPIDSESQTSMRSEKLCCLMVGSSVWYRPLYQSLSMHCTTILEEAGIYSSIGP